jgi:hypothetical protein
MSGARCGKPRTSLCSPRLGLLEQRPDIGTPVADDFSIQIFALQPHLHIKLEVIFLPIRTYRIVDLKLLIVFVHFELAAGTSLSLNRSGELGAFVLSNLAIGERRQRRYGEYSIDMINRMSKFLLWRVTPAG